MTDASTVDEAPAEVYPCSSGRLSPESELIPVNGTGEYNIKNVNSQIRMSVLNAPDTVAHQHIVQETCATSQDNQIWSVVKAPGSEAAYRFVPAASNECLDLPNGAVCSAYQSHRYDCQTTDPSQGWTLNPVVPVVTH